MKKNKWKSINFSSSFPNFLFLTFLLGTCLSEGDSRGWVAVEWAQILMGYFLSAHHTLTLLNIPRIILYFFNLFTEPRKIFLGCDCVGEVLDYGYEGEFDSFTFSESIEGEENLSDARKVGWENGGRRFTRALILLSQQTYTERC